MSDQYWLPFIIIVPVNCVFYASYLIRSPYTFDIRLVFENEFYFKEYMNNIEDNFLNKYLISYHLENKNV